MQRIAPLSSRYQQVAQTDVPEGTPHHDLVIAPPGTKGVEIPGFDPLGNQVVSSGFLPGDGSGRRDMVGGDGIPEQGQNPHSRDVLQGLRFPLHPLEKRRLFNVGGLIRPGKSISGRDGQGLPGLIPAEHIRVFAGEHLTGHHLGWEHDPAEQSLRRLSSD